MKLEKIKEGRYRLRVPKSEIEFKECMKYLLEHKNVEDISASTTFIELKEGGFYMPVSKVTPRVFLAYSVMEYGNYDQARIEDDCTITELTSGANSLHLGKDFKSVSVDYKNKSLSIIK